MKVALITVGALLLGIACVGCDAAESGKASNSMVGTAMPKPPSKPIATSTTEPTAPRGNDKDKTDPGSGLSPGGRSPQ